jgi:hypothetical protein
MRNSALALLASVIGGILGYLGFMWIARQGFYGLVLPGALVGICAGFFKNQSVAVCIVCGIVALCVGLFAEWRFAPFVRDESLSYFLAHLHQLRPITMILIAAGVLIGFGVPFRNRNRNGNK